MRQTDTRGRWLFHNFPKHIEHAIGRGDRPAAEAALGTLCHILDAIAAELPDAGADSASYRRTFEHAIGAKSSIGASNDFRNASDHLMHLCDRVAGYGGLRPGGVADALTRPVEPVKVYVETPEPEPEPAEWVERDGHFGEIPHGRGAFRVARGRHQWGARFDRGAAGLVSIASDADHNPSSLAIPLAVLPAIRAALEAAEADAIVRGVLKPDTYERLGLPMPGRSRPPRKTSTPEPTPEPPAAA